MIIRVGMEESMRSLAARIQKRLDVKDEEFAKWQFRHLRGIMNSDADLIQPDEIVCERVPGIPEAGEKLPPDCLGFQHTLTHSKRANRMNHGAGIKIH